MKRNWIINLAGCFILPLFVIAAAIHYSVFIEGEMLAGTIGCGVFWLYFLFCAIASDKWRVFLVTVVAENGIPLAFIHNMGFVYAGIGIFVTLLILQFLLDKRGFIILNSIFLLLATAGISGFVWVCYQVGKAFDSSWSPSPLYPIGMALPIFLSLLAVILRFALLSECKRELHVDVHDDSARGGGQ